jgi:hypothetical protein
MNSFTSIALFSLLAACGTSHAQTHSTVQDNPGDKCTTTCVFVCTDRVFHTDPNQCDSGHNVCTTTCIEPDPRRNPVPTCPNDIWVVDENGVVRCAG